MSKDIVKLYLTFKDKQSCIHNENADLSILSNDTELELLIEVLQDFNDSKILLHTTNIYIKNLISEWLNEWKKEKFMIKEDKRPNYQLLKRLDDVIDENHLLITCTYVYDLTRITSD